jgi:hypothetical protein
MRIARMLGQTWSCPFSEQTSIKLGIDSVLNRINFLAPTLRCSFELLSTNLHTHRGAESMQRRAMKRPAGSARKFCDKIDAKSRSRVRVFVFFRPLCRPSRLSEHAGPPPCLTQQIIAAKSRNWCRINQTSARARAFLLEPSRSGFYAPTENYVANKTTR